MNIPVHYICTVWWPMYKGCQKCSCMQAMKGESGQQVCVVLLPYSMDEYCVNSPMGLVITAPHPFSAGRGVRGQLKVETQMMPESMALAAIIPMHT